MPLNIKGNILSSNDVTSVGVFKSKINRDGLMLYLDASDINSYPGSGTVWYDLSGNGYNHNLFSASFTTQDSVSCFDCTTTGYIIPASSTYQFTSTYTMIAWGRALTNAQTASWRTLFRPLPNDHPILVQSGSDLIGYYDNDAAGFQSYGLTIAGVGAGNKWTMFSIVGTAEGRTTLYINGCTYYGSVAYNATGMSSDAIGNVNGGSQPFGYVGSAFLYNRSLNPYELAENFQANRGRFGV